jgi:tRNA U34 5-carboxymethylaminomethyl modifying enzyme MnmG/GidA
MGRVIDRTGIQFRLLNRSRGQPLQAPALRLTELCIEPGNVRTLEATPISACGGIGH